MIIVIFDIESTCWNKMEQQLISEIIEIGAIKIDTVSNKIVGEFQQFVNPFMNPKLSEFCKDLTTITQNDVDNSDGLVSVLSKFDEFVGDARLTSWGFYDKKQIERECFLKKINSPLIKKLDNHISLKHKFGEIFGCQPPGLSKALSMVKINFKGTQHRGIDDAKNITKVYFIIKDKL